MRKNWEPNLVEPLAQMDTGTHRKVMKLSLRLTSEIRLTRWRQKAQAKGPACFAVTGTHPESNPAEFTTLRLAANWNQERSNPVRALRPGSTDRSRCPPQGVRGGIESEANASL